MKTTILYHCDDCGRGIHATADDPVHKPAHRTLCKVCIGKSPPVEQEPKVDGRGAAAKQRWANMTPEERAERVRRMQAGRNHVS